MRKRMLLSLVVVLFGVAVALRPDPVRAQAGFEDDRVMLQGFYWESYRHGHPEKFPSYGTKRWYQIVAEQAPTIRHARFDLIWLPPPSFAGAHSAGYNPKEYFELGNSYGDLAQHRSMLASLLENGVEPIADLVINHRDGSRSWADFKNPDWGTWAITRNDEAFTNPDSDVFATPEPERGAVEERPLEYAQHGGTTYGYGSFRDIDHTSARVRRDLIRHLLQLKSAGYRGWRYDMVHGYHANGWPCTTAPPVRPFPSANTTGTSPTSSGAGSGTRRPCRAARHREQRVRFHDHVSSEGQQEQLRRPLRVWPRNGRRYHRRPRLEKPRGDIRAEP